MKYYIKQLIIVLIMLVAEVDASPIASSMSYTFRADSTSPMLMNLNNIHKKAEEKDVDGIVWRKSDENNGNMTPLHAKTFHSDEWRVVNTEGKQQIMLCNYRYVKYGSKTKCRARDGQSLALLKDAKELPLNEALSQIHGQEVDLSLVAPKGYKLYVEYRISNKSVDKDWAFLNGFDSNNYSAGHYVAVYALIFLIFSPFILFYVWQKINDHLYYKRELKRARERHLSEQIRNAKAEKEQRDELPSHMDLVTESVVSSVRQYTDAYVERIRSDSSSDEGNEVVRASVSTQSDDSDAASGDRPDHNIKKPGARKVFL